MEVRIEQIAQQAIDAISERIKNLNHLNIIIAGKTGVGKSTLINAVFRDNLAETGMGRPVTTHMIKISKNDMPLSIYDTRGFELGKEVQSEVKQEIINTIKNSFSHHDINEAIHCIWYCINTACNRVEPNEIEWLRELSEESSVTQIPIIVVLTQSFNKKNAETIKKLIDEENLNVMQIVPVLAEKYEIDGLGTIPPFGLDTLIQVMENVLPKELSDTLQNVQIASLKSKKIKAQAAVAAASVAATGEGAVPVPFADCAMLIPTQIGMIVSITVIFGFNVNKSIITALLSSTIGSGGATVLGKTVVTNILKLIPGAGTVAGSAISAATASLITIALGEAYIGVMELIFKGEMSIDDLSTEKGKKTMSSLFKEKLKSSNHKKD